MRKDISNTTIGHIRTDYGFNSGGRYVKNTSTTEHNFWSAVHLQSDVVKGDFFKPTAYKGVKAFSGSGKYHKNERYIDVKGPAFSILSSFSFPFIGRLNGSTFWRNDPGPTFSDNAVISAMSKAANINFNGLVALGEARSTADTLSTTVKQILGIAVAIKKLDYKKVRKLIKGNKPAIVGNKKGQISKARYKRMMRKKFNKKNLYAPSDLWLQYRYGIMPLINDSNAIAAALSGRIERRMTQKVVGGQKTSWDDSTSYGGTKTNRQFKLTAYFHCLFDVSSPKWATASESGFAHIPLALWELIPFSFVADWALPIGKWLTALTTIPNVNFVHGFYGYKLKGTVSQEHSSRNAFGPTTWSQSARFDAYKRKPVRRIPIPIPRFKAPIKGLSDLDKVADIFALLRQLTK